MFSSVVGNITDDIYNIRVSRLNKMNFVDIYIKNDLYVELKKDAHFYKKFAEYNKSKIN